MGIKTKTALAATFVGVVAMAAAAFGQTGDGGTSRPSEPEATVSPDAPRERSPEAARRRAQRPDERRCDRPPTRRARRVVHSETKVKTPDGFAVVTVDQGEITRIDKDDDRITIRRLDGETVSATATDETRVCKDGKPATFDQLEVGDHARLVQIRSERFTGLRRISTIAPGSEPAEPARARPADFSGAEFDEMMGEIY